MCQAVQYAPIATNRNQSQLMHIIVVDTETTGLIPKGIASRDLAKCPHIMQLSYMVLNTDNFKIREDYDAIVRLGDDVEISERSIEIHKITELKKIKSVFIISELKRLNNYNTFTITI